MNTRKIEVCYSCGNKEAELLWFAIFELRNDIAMRLDLIYNRDLWKESDDEQRRRRVREFEESYPKTFHEYVWLEAQVRTLDGLLENYALDHKALMAARMPYSLYRDTKVDVNQGSFQDFLKDAQADIQKWKEKLSVKETNS